MRPARRTPPRLLPPSSRTPRGSRGAATLIIAIVYTGCVTALDLVVARRLTGQTDARLGDRLTEATRSRVTALPAKDGDDDGDVDDAPLFLWLVGPGGHVGQLSSDAPALPRGLRPGPGWPVTTVIGAKPLPAGRPARRKPVDSRGPEPGPEPAYRIGPAGQRDRGGPAAAGWPCSSAR